MSLNAAMARLRRLAAFEETMSVLEHQAAALNCLQHAADASVSGGYLSTPQTWAILAQQHIAWAEYLRLREAMTAEGIDRRKIRESDDDNAAGSTANTD